MEFKKKGTKKVRPTEKPTPAEKPKSKFDVPPPKWSRAPKPTPPPPKVETVSVSEEHIELVAAVIFGGCLTPQSDNRKMRPVIDDSIALARELISANRGKPVA